MIKWVLGGVGLILVAVIAFVGLRHYEAANRMRELQSLEYYSELKEHVFVPCVREIILRSGIAGSEALDPVEVTEELNERVMNEPEMQVMIKLLNEMVAGMSLENRMYGYGIGTRVCIKSAMEVVDSELKNQ